MFLVSLKSLKGKLILLLCAVAAAVVLCIVFSSDKAVSPKEPASGQVNAALNFSAATENDRMNFMKQLGYTVKTEPESVGDILIPDEFDDMYAAYNELQKDCGLDLSDYKGCNAKKWTYVVTNYPGFENDDSIRLNMIVYRGKIIGGDVCSVKLDGFMHGFTGR